MFIGMESLNPMAGAAHMQKAVESNYKEPNVISNKQYILMASLVPLCDPLYNGNLHSPEAASVPMSDVFFLLY